MKQDERIWTLNVQLSMIKRACAAKLRQKSVGHDEEELTGAKDFANDVLNIIEEYGEKK